MIEHSLWDVEVAFYTNKRGIDHDKARTFTIIRWMYHGDLRPLAAAIAEGFTLDQAVLNLLARMIIDGRLTIAPRQRGRPRKPELFARDVVAALAYEAHPGNSEEAFEEIAKAIGVSDRTVRQAFTAYRKAQRKVSGK
jgi:hypothetical protein